MGEIRIERATMEDRPRIVDFLCKSFYRDEPLNIAMGLTDEPSIDDIDHSLKSLPHGFTLIAFIDDVLVGVAINGEIADDEVNVRQKMYEECECPDFMKFLKFWVHVEKTADFWRRHGVTRALDLEILAVDPVTRRRGVGRRLIAETKSLAIELGYPMLRVDCSSYYAAKMAESQGLTCVFEIRYDEYKNEEGEPVFKTSPPHEALKIYILKL